MKKSSLIVWLIVTCMCIFLIGGYLFFKHEEKVAFVNKQEKRITLFFKYNVPSYKKTTFTKDKTIPTGSIYIHGYINGDQSLSFSAAIYLADGEENFEGDISYSSKLDSLMRKNMKSVSQIEKIKKEDQN